MPRYDQGPSVRYDSGLRYDDTGIQPAPNAAHTALTAAHDDLEQEYNKLLDAEQLAKTIRDRVHAKQDTLIDAMGTFASYAEALTEGDLAKLHAAGFQVAGTPGMSAAITGLPSGQRIWVRVRAIGTSETAPGPWSDPAVRTVP